MTASIAQVSSPSPAFGRPSRRESVWILGFPRFSYSYSARRAVLVLVLVLDRLDRSSRSTILLSTSTNSSHKMLVILKVTHKLSHFRKTGNIVLSEGNVGTIGRHAALSAFGTACVAFSLRLFPPFLQEVRICKPRIASSIACFLLGRVADLGRRGSFAISSRPKNRHEVALENSLIGIVIRG